MENNSKNGPTITTNDKGETIFTGLVIVGGVNDVRETTSGKKVLSVGGYTQVDGEQSTRVALTWWQNLATFHHGARKKGDCVWITGKLTERTFETKKGTQSETQIAVQGFKLVSTVESRAAKAA